MLCVRFQVGPSNNVGVGETKMVHSNRSSRLATILAWLFPLMLIAHVVMEIVNSYRTDWDPITGPYPLGSPMRFWEPNGIYSLFVFFNLLLMSVIFVYISWTGVSADPPSAVHRAKGFGTLCFGLTMLVITLVIAGISAWVSSQFFPSAAPLVIFMGGLAQIAWVTSLLGIAMMISGRDLLAESERQRKK